MAGEKKILFKSKTGILLFLLLTTIGTCYSQDPNLDLYSLDFNQLSKLKITSATKTEQGVDKIPSTIRIITEKDIEERGYFTLDEVLSDLPGFQFRNIMSLNSYIFQRGIPNQNNLTLVLIDGVQVNELNSGGFYGGGQYNLSNIERIEVIYGPSSVAYGTNAVSGIINIITKKPEKNRGKIHALYGNFNTTNASASYSYYNQDRNLGFHASAMFKSTEKANLKGKNGDYNWTDLLDNFEDDYSFDIKLCYKNLTFGTNYLNKQSSASTYRKAVGTGYKDYGSLWNIMFMNNYLKYEKELNVHLNFSGKIYNRNATVQKNTVYFVTDTSQVGYFRPNNLTGIEGVLSYKMNKIFSATGGIMAEFEQLANGPTITYSTSSDIMPPIPQMPAMHENYLISAFVEPELVLFENLIFSGGLRFDLSSIYQQVITPRAGVKYNHKNISLGLLYAEAFRAPKPWDYTDGLGNNTLIPEQINSFEVNASALAGNNFQFDVSLYHNTLENGFIKEYSTGGYRWVNSTRFITLGAEAGIRYSNKFINAILNYTYTNSTDENGNALPEISYHSANALITVPIGKKIKINMRANYAGQRENPKTIATTNSNYIDPYLIFNSAITWKPINVLTVQLIGKNIFNSEYYHTSNRDPDRYRQPQQTIMLSVAYSFYEK
ncbi:MAG: TonB-dependent receptor [Prolixibacteraceae bacterium]|nr:TonB-dependent receptor [Prolixibacteraceae bacterium]